MHVAKKDALVVYLAGSEDLDREVAIQKGFSGHNLIAVDISEDVVHTLKKKKALCINGNIIDVIRSFTKTKQKIDVLVADFCHGLTEETAILAHELSTALNGNAFNSDSQILINLMRGRDAGNMLFSHKTMSDDLDLIVRNIKNLFVADNNDLHRGRMFVEHVSVLGAIINAIALSQSCTPDEYGRILNDTLKLTSLVYDSNDALGVGAFKKLLLLGMDPVFRSYKSGNIYMDSALFTYSPGCFASTRIDRHTKELENSAIKNKLISTLAVRTMKKNGTLA